jgi:hypothetical protein
MLVPLHLGCCLPKHVTHMWLQVSDHILSRSLPNPQAVRLLLKCLNHLRSQQLDALKRTAPLADGTKDPTKWHKV